MSKKTDIIAQLWADVYKECLLNNKYDSHFAKDRADTAVKNAENALKGY